MRVSSSRRRSWFRRFRRKLGMVVLSTVGPAVFQLLARTWKIELLEGDRLEGALVHGPGRILVLWHGRMCIGISYHSKRKYKVLVSPSADGDLANRLLKAFDYQIVRGSTNKRAPHAVRQLLTALGEGQTVVVTPDGPRGPRHSMNAGVAFLARETGYAIVPIGLMAKSAWRMNSWDAFTIPKPWTRVAITYGEPLTVQPDVDDAGLDAASDEVKRRLIAAERQCCERLGVEPDW